MLATAFPAIAAATERECNLPWAGLILLTRNEIAGLFNAVIITPATGARHRLRSSAWQRRH